MPVDFVKRQPDLAFAGEALDPSPAEGRLRSFIERPDRQYSPEEKAENKRLLDDLRLAMVEYSEAFEQAIRS